MRLINSGWSKLRATNVLAAGAETTLAATTGPITSLPTGAFLVDGARVVLARFYGTDTNNQTGTIHIYGIHSRNGSAYDNDSGELNFYYLPTQLGTAVVTLGQATGVAGTPILTTELLADTVTITASGENAYERLFGYNTGGLMDSWTTTDGWAELVIMNPGFQWMHIQFNTFTSWVAMNGIYALLNEREC